MADEAEADDLRPEYDFKSLKVVSRGRYAKGYAKARRVVALDPDLYPEFPDDAAVNAALREYLRGRAAAATGTPV